MQYPLTLSWALTIHKEQGKTEDQVVLSLKGNFGGGQFYTAISRPRTMEGLYILDEMDSSKIKVNQKSLNEIARMKEDAPFTPPVPLAMAKTLVGFLKVNFLNINSLIPHFSSLIKDEFIQQCHVTSLAETWLTPTDIHPEIPNFNTVRLDNSNSQSKRRNGGLLSYICQDLYLVKEMRVRNVPSEYQMMILSPCQDKSVRFLILTLYNHPRNSVNTFLCTLEKLLSTIPDGMKAVVMGDFNIDMFNNNNSTKQLSDLCKYYGFHQLCKEPTHRRGGLIDLCYTNIHSEDVILSQIPLYYSDHQLLCVAVPFKLLL